MHWAGEIHDYMLCVSYVSLYSLLTCDCSLGSGCTRWEEEVELLFFEYFELDSLLMMGITMSNCCRDGQLDTEVLPLLPKPS